MVYFFVSASRGVVCMLQTLAILAKFIMDLSLIFAKLQRGEVRPLHLNACW